jgi:hypothetical protein
MNLAGVAYPRRPGMCRGSQAGLHIIHLDLLGVGNNDLRCRLNAGKSIRGQYDRQTASYRYCF